MIMKARGTVMRREHRHGWQPRRGCTSQHVWNTNDAGCKTTDYETWALGGDKNLRHRAVSLHHPSAHKSVNKYNLCTHAGSGVVLTTQDVLFKDTYIFLLLHVRATRKVSYMRYKQHLGESCNVITTYSWKYSVYVCMFGCRTHHPRRFIQRSLYILAPTCLSYAKSIIYAI